MSILADILNDLIPQSSDLLTNPAVWTPIGGTSGGAGYYGNYATSSGETVNEKTALLISTHFACIRCKSEDLSVLPKEIVEITEDGEKESRRDHPAYSILNEQFNPEMTALVGCSTLLAHAIGFKKGVAEIERDGAGDPVWLWPMDPTCVTKKRINGRIWHECRMDGGKPEMLPDEDVIEIIGPSYDGLIGYSMAEITKYVTGLATAAQKFQGSFFGNGAWLGGVIEELPASMKPEQMEVLRNSFNSRHQTAGRAFGVGILPGTAKYKPMGIEPDKGQVIETLNYTVDDLCRFHRVPPHKVQNYKDAHFNNVEHAEIVYRGDSLLPLGTALEQEIKRKLLPVEMRVIINYNAFQRVDFKTQQDALSAGQMWGRYTINEARRKLGEDPDDNPLCDMRFVPANMIPIVKAMEDRTQQSTNAAPGKEEPDHVREVRAVFVGLVADGLRRAVAKEEKAVKRIQAKGKGHEAEINAFYDEHRQCIAQNVIPLLGSMVTILGGGYAVAERLTTLGDMFCALWAQDRPATKGAISSEYITERAEQWIDATIDALEQEAA